MQAEIDDERICLEGYGPAGVAVILTCRGGSTAPDVDEARRRFAAHGGRIGAQGSVSYLFRPVGVIRVRGEPGLVQRALAWGAEEVTGEESGEIEILTDPRDCAALAGRLGRGRPATTATAWRSMQRATVGPADRRRLEGLVADLRALEGVHGVYTNA